MKFGGRVIRAIAAFFVCVVSLGAIAVSAFAAPRARPSEAAGAAGVSAKDLNQLCRELKKEPRAAYQRLSAIALGKSSGVVGMRASLALGYFDFDNGNYALALKWLERAKSDPLLRDYSLYWSAAAHHALAQDAEALAELKQLRTDVPNSVMTEQALEALGDSALAVNQPGDALEALESYARTSSTPALVFLRARAREQAGDPIEAAADYQIVYLRYATSTQASEAALKLDFLRRKLGEQLPPVPIEQRFDRADALFAAKLFSEARTEYEQILPQLSGADRERAQLRVLECVAQFGAGPSGLAELQISDPDVDTERLAALADVYRALGQEAQLVDAVETAAKRSPASQWTAAALFLAGNYFWVDLNRDRAAYFYKKVADDFPISPDAYKAQWRVAWTAVVNHDPRAADLVAEHIRRYGGSVNTPDALYWLGRLAERSGEPRLARTYYDKLVERYPQNYFESLGAARLRALGNGDRADPDVLSWIPPVPAVPALGPAIPAAAMERQARADALHSITFDASAEMELRAAYIATGEPRLLLEAAQAAVAAGHCGAAAAIVRQIYPQLESRRFEDVPREVWLAAYPIPFESSIRRWSASAGVDPMAVAGLIRQESAWEPEARSDANALGLMQVLPKTGRRMARQAKTNYATAMLLTPDYNIRLGTLYFADLRRQFGSTESALAAYNAGEDRLAFWTAGQNYPEVAAFVDSIPFTETREYVQIVMRNTEIYRKLYGAKNEPGKPRPRPPISRLGPIHSILRTCPYQ
jgi:soluble lytic murein transglycosylase